MVHQNYYNNIIIIHLYNQIYLVWLIWCYNYIYIHIYKFILYYYYSNTATRCSLSIIALFRAIRYVRTVKIVNLLIASIIDLGMAAGFTFNFCVEEEEAIDGNGVERETIVELQDVKVVKERPGSNCTSSELTDTANGETVAEAREIPILPFHVELLDHVIPSRLQLPPAPVQDCRELQILYIDITSVERVAKAMKKDVTEKRSDTDYTTTESSSSSCKTGNCIPSLGSGTGLVQLLELSNSIHSDLIPGVYEGGLKVWECAFDLVEYLAKSEIQFSGKRVLELGCGAGLPAIFTLMKGAENVHFQDYNPQVIDYVTIPSVLLNINLTSPTADLTTLTNSKCKFYSGDWSTLTQLIPLRQYDIILTSETIYSSSSQPKLLAALKHLLCPLEGVAYVAAKSYYFGVGGSVSSFIDRVKEDGYFIVEKFYVVDSEVSRAILRLKPSRKKG